MPVKLEDFNDYYDDFYYDADWDDFGNCRSAAVIKMFVYFFSLIQDLAITTVVSTALISIEANTFAPITILILALKKLSLKTWEVLICI